MGKGRWRLQHIYQGQGPVVRVFFLRSLHVALARGDVLDASSFTELQIELCVNGVGVNTNFKEHQAHTHTHTHIFSRRTHVPRSTNGCRTTCGRLSRDTKLSRRGGRSRHEGAATPTHRHSAYTAPNRGHEQSKGSTPRRDALPLTHTSMNTKDVPPSASLGETEPNYMKSHARPSVLRPWPLACRSRQRGGALTSPAVQAA